MEHVAIDLGGSQSQVCVRAADGAIVEERQCRTTELATVLSKRPPSRVIVETCAEAFHVADALRASGHDVRVVAATLVRSLGVGARGLKTDRRDAQVLSEVSTRIDLRGVHIPSATSRERKAMCTSREALVSARTQLINCTRGWMRTRGIRVRSGWTRTFAKRVRATLGTDCPEHIAALLSVVEALDLQIVQLDVALKQLANEDPVCRQLMSAPGVGPLTAIRFTASVDQPERFPNAHRLESYFGLTPGEDSSGGRQRRTGISKAGSAPTRRVLVQAALTAKRCARNDPMVRWALEIEKRRGKQVATVALARKMAGVLFAMWRDGTLYQSRSAAAVTH
ncbi:MAG TPA: IS110 family transposase [Polyangiaceae bacterium]|nr:IS110 family transposase [Polyangiaceae bacterium]